MCNRKRLKKLQKYIQLSELSKFRSYAKRHSVDVIGLLDEHGNSLIHLSCMYGCEVILRSVEGCGTGLIASALSEIKSAFLIVHILLFKTHNL